MNWNRLAGFMWSINVLGWGFLLFAAVYSRDVVMSVWFGIMLLISVVFVVHEWRELGKKEKEDGEKI